MSQFAFLAAEFPEVHAQAVKAEAAARSDPRAGCFYARLALEALLDWVYRKDGSLKSPYEATLAARLHEASFQRLVGRALHAKADLIRRLGNRAVHETRAVPAAEAIAATRELFHLGFWLARTYGRHARPPDDIRFSADALPFNRLVTAERLDHLEAAAARFAQTVAAREAAEQARRASETRREALEAELARVHAEIAALKAANAAVADKHDYDEAQTRDRFIDLLLAEAGWPLDQAGRTANIAVDGHAQRRPARASSTMCCGARTASRSALVEAKRTRRDPRVGQQQAKLYADCLERQFGQRPVIFYTNGYRALDLGRRALPAAADPGILHPGRAGAADPAPRRRRRPLAADAEIDRAIVERHYQHRAIRRVAEAFEPDQQRKALLVMATGAGKTRTVIALARPADARRTGRKRVLFLADRVALVQPGASTRSRRTCPASPPVNLVTDKRGDGPRLRLDLSDDDGPDRRAAATDERPFGPGFFDLVVIDEAHRSVYRKYGAIFDYFDTPAGRPDRDAEGRGRPRHLPPVRSETRRADRRLRPRRGGRRRLPRAAAGGLACR